MSTSFRITLLAMFLMVLVVGGFASFSSLEKRIKRARLEAELALVKREYEKATAMMKSSLDDRSLPESSATTITRGNATSSSLDRKFFPESSATGAAEDNVKSLSSYQTEQQGFSRQSSESSAQKKGTSAVYDQNTAYEEARTREAEERLQRFEKESDVPDRDKQKFLKSAARYEEALCKERLEVPTAFEAAYVEEERLKKLEEEKAELERQREFVTAERYKEALHRKRLEEERVRTLELLEKAERVHRQQKARDAAYKTPGTIMCPTVDKMVKNNLQSALEQKVEKILKCGKEHAIEDLDGYTDELEERFEPTKADKTESSSSEDLARYNDFLRKESFEDRYFATRERDSDIDLLNTAYVDSPPTRDSPPLGALHTNPNSRGSTAKKNAAVQASPLSDSKEVQAAVETPKTKRNAGSLMPFPSSSKVQGAFHTPRKCFSVVKDLLLKKESDMILSESSYADSASPAHAPNMFPSLYMTENVFYASSNDDNIRKPETVEPVNEIEEVKQKDVPFFEACETDLRLLPPLSNDVGSSNTSSYLDHISKKYGTNDDAASSIPISKPYICAIPLSDPIREKPTEKSQKDFVTNLMIGVNDGYFMTDVGGDFLPVNSLPREKKVESLSLIANLSQEEDESSIDGSTENINSYFQDEKIRLNNLKTVRQQLIQELKRNHFNLEDDNTGYEQGSGDHSIPDLEDEVQILSNDIPFIYHELSTIQELDSSLTAVQDDESKVMLRKKSTDSSETEYKYPVANLIDNHIDNVLKLLKNITILPQKSPEKDFVGISKFSETLQDSTINKDTSLSAQSSNSSDVELSESHKNKGSGNLLLEAASDMTSHGSLGANIYYPTAALLTPSVTDRFVKDNSSLNSRSNISHFSSLAPHHVSSMSSESKVPSSNSAIIRYPSITAHEKPEKNSFYLDNTTLAKFSPSNTDSWPSDKNAMTSAGCKQSNIGSTSAKLSPSNTDSWPSDKNAMASAGCKQNNIGSTSAKLSPSNTDSWPSDKNVVASAGCKQSNIGNFGICVSSLKSPIPCYTSSSNDTSLMSANSEFSEKRIPLPNPTSNFIGSKLSQFRCIPTTVDQKVTCTDNDDDKFRNYSVIKSHQDSKWLKLNTEEIESKFGEVSTVKNPLLKFSLKTNEQLTSSDDEKSFKPLTPHSTISSENISKDSCISTTVGTLSDTASSSVRSLETKRDMLSDAQKISVIRDIVLKQQKAYFKDSSESPIQSVSSDERVSVLKKMLQQIEDKRPVEEKKKNHVHSNLRLAALQSSSHSSEDSLSNMFSRSKIGFHSTPVRSESESLYEEGILEQPDITLIGDELTLHQTLAAETRRKISDAHSIIPRISELSQTKTESSLRSMKISQSSVRIVNNNGEEQRILVEKEYLEQPQVGGRFSASMLSFLSHEISSSDTPDEEHVSLISSQASGCFSSTCSTSSEMTPKTKEMNIENATSSSKKKMREQTVSSSSQSSNENYKQRTKRLWNNLAEVKAKQELAERKRTFMLNKQKVKELQEKLQKKGGKGGKSK